MRQFFIASLTGIILWSCGNSNHDIALQQTDSLLNIVILIDTTIASYELDTAKDRYKTMKNEVEFFGMYLTVLPEDSLQRISLSEYANTSKGFKRFFNNLTTFVTSIKFTRSQLENLKADIINGVLDKDETAKFLSEEKKAVNDLHTEMQKSIEKYNWLCSEAASRQKTVLQIVDSLKKVNKIQ